uniref:Transmembrane protein 256 homolog n=1 Tax=Glossina pallidipes TaxID=7398 RepID=A0A1B0A231_GLOPL
MTWGDALHYLAIGNPISQALVTTTSAVLKESGIKPKQHSLPLPPAKPLKLWEIAGVGYNFVRLAGLSGTAAVIMGAYAKHCLSNISDPSVKMEAKNIFDTANRFHFLHSIVLLTMPLARRPALTGSLKVAGTFLFSGPMYYRALTGNKTYIQVATCGGFCLIAAWLSLIF